MAPAKSRLEVTPFCSADKPVMPIKDSLSQEDRLDTKWIAAGGSGRSAPPVGKHPMPAEERCRLTMGWWVRTKC